MILARETLDYAESQLSEEEQRQLLKHVICTISGRPNINPKPHSYQTGDAQHEEDDENDDDSLNEVTNMQNFSNFFQLKLTMCKLFKKREESKTASLKTKCVFQRLFGVFLFSVSLSKNNIEVFK